MLEACHRSIAENCVNFEASSVALPFLSSGHMASELSFIRSWYVLAEYKDLLCFFLKNYFCYYNFFVIITVYFLKYTIKLKVLIFFLFFLVQDGS